MPRPIVLLLLLTSASFLPALAGCASQRIAIAERFGYAKREQLVDSIEDARDEQSQAKEQFASALDEFLALTQADGGELEKTYRRLNSAYERSERQAADVTERIDQVERVADALFREWERELDQYASEEFRRASADQLTDTRSRYEGLLRAMRRAEASMQPVLASFGDQVLFLKHNLNARAIASLDQTVAGLETDVAGLIREMEASIAEANAFIEAMDASTTTGG